ncbi:hypothetical protein JCGZ_26697 [Jatropha curcas]|uniref:Aminotransferase-like plant mobile domain-containing protein n=1 Tax=Jatropha curcas TaxID=180498 RepID=A0A067JNA4_JATCU|nr:hypothetical protein JCGZ_26697 [Jatropha curcas]
MAQLSEIPASAYTPEMDTLGAIPVFEGDRAPMRHAYVLQKNSCMTQLLVGGCGFDKLRGAATWLRDAAVDLGKARAGGSSTDASAFWDLLDPPMRSRVVAAGFGDFAAGLRRTQPRFPPAMRYALMKRWNDCTHSFVFGFREMTLTPADYTAITGLDLTARLLLLMDVTRQLHWELS